MRELPAPVVGPLGPFKASTKLKPIVRTSSRTKEVDQTEDEIATEIQAENQVFGHAHLQVHPQAQAQAEEQVREEAQAGPTIENDANSTWTQPSSSTTSLTTIGTCDQRSETPNQQLLRARLPTDAPDGETAAPQTGLSASTTSASPAPAPSPAIPIETLTGRLGPPLAASWAEVEQRQITVSCLVGRLPSPSGTHPFTIHLSAPETQGPPLRQPFPPQPTAQIAPNLSCPCHYRNPRRKILRPVLLHMSLILYTRFRCSSVALF